MTKPLSKREKARRRQNAASHARQRRQDDNWERALYTLVKAGMTQALVVTYRGIQLGNSEMTHAEALDLARDIVGTNYVIDRAMDVAVMAMGEERPNAKEAVRQVAEAAEKAALETFTLRHKLPAGRA